MADVTNERWYQHSTILTLKGELAAMKAHAEAAEKRVKDLEEALIDALSFWENHVYRDDDREELDRLAAVLEDKLGPPPMAPQSEP